MRNSLISNYRILILYSLSFLIFGLLVDTPAEILAGLKTIIVEPDILITDYLEIGGLGASFVNSALICLACIFILIKIGIKPNGSTYAAIFTTCGFAFFGKNISNIWPIFIGTWLYSKYKKEPYLNYILVALFGSTLAPTVSQISFSSNLPWWLGIGLGISLGIFIGFILPPISSYCVKMHEGYNLYNSGFAAGLVATLIMGVFRSFGIEFEHRYLWSTEYTGILFVFLIIIFLSMILIGYHLNDNSFKNLKLLCQQPGRSVSDYYLQFGEGCCLINMGILGIIFTVYVVSVNGDLNGPTMAGIFTIVGFGAFGKHPKNTLPVAFGTVIASLLNIWPINSAGMLLSTLLSTTLAPIAGSFGAIYGIIAGFLHTCMVMNVGYLHAGLNLYNNGFSGGLVAIILLPIITNLRKEN
ncbi:DUF1576 domain-containing protein [Clostridium sp. MSJ-11]|uniref:DUF1576 domain-containing protein n=1 Tax=Clostridium mobile TaxID=2841512 RepID=A0ABS6EQ33_9CLOT|nr:DUF1576 domain-containing protein [Clostridium mobile]MBU5486504.1 DUF1576 domain-containing protein [Clostridium mobile]